MSNIFFPRFSAAAAAAVRERVDGATMANIAEHHAWAAYKAGHDRLAVSLARGYAMQPWAAARKFVLLDNAQSIAHVLDRRGGSDHPPARFNYARVCALFPSQDHCRT
jgi:hypothetical protein